MSIVTWSAISLTNIPFFPALIPIPSKNLGDSISGVVGLPFRSVFAEVEGILKTVLWSAFLAVTGNENF